MLLPPYFPTRCTFKISILLRYEASLQLATTHGNVSKAE